MWKCKFKRLGLLVLLPSALAHGETLQNIRAYEAPDHTRVVLDTSAVPQGQHLRPEQPDRLVIDLANTRPAAGFDPDVSSVTGRRVRSIRWGAQPRAYRVVLDLDKPLQAQGLPVAAHRTVRPPSGHRSFR